MDAPGGRSSAQRECVAQREEQCAAPVASRVIESSESRVCRERSDGEPGEVAESPGVGGDDGSGVSKSRGRDEQVMRASGAAGLACMGEQLSVDSGDLEIVWLDRDGGQERFDERLSRWLVPAIGELNSDQQFGRSDCGDHDIVIVTNDLVDRRRRPFRCDQDRRVED